MKVKAWKTVDIECEVDVTLDHFIDEMLIIASEEGMSFRKVRAIDGATRILERITPDMVADKLANNQTAIELLGRRLSKWIKVARGKANAG